MSDWVTAFVGAPSKLERRESPASAPSRRYTVLEEVGRGGMGRVLRAYDRTLQREVALKEVPSDLLERDSSARLLAEARAMAHLSHPHVVPVYDVHEAPTGQVMLVMAYVPGHTLDDWLEAEPRSTAAIVEKLVQAGRGLQAAHEAGVLHRDFKPSNVLVSEDGRVMVTDFGIATTGRSGPDAGGEVEGTPLYMAPEQHDGRPLTAAADQFAFCVTVWEALCGAPPFRGDDRIEHKRRGPPAWPNTSPSGVGRSRVAAIMRGLSPDPSERWPSMRALLRALETRPAHGRRALVAVAVVAAVVEAWKSADGRNLCTGASEQLSGVWDTQRKRDVKQALLAVGRSHAADVWTRIEGALDEYADAWTVMHTQACEATRLEATQSEAVLDLRMACLHRARVGLEAAVDVLAEADDETVQKAHDVVGSLRPLERCADVEALGAEVEPPEPRDAPAVETARTLLAEAHAATRAGRYEDASAKVEAARAALAAVDYMPVRVELQLADGDVEEELGDYARAERSLRDALSLAARTRQQEAMVEAAAQLFYAVGHRQRRVDEGLVYEALARASLVEGTEIETRLDQHLALVLDDQGKYEQAEAIFRRRLGLLAQEHDPQWRTVNLRDGLANNLQHQGRYAEAEVEHRRALAASQAALGPEHPHVGRARSNLANVLAEQGKYDEAEAEHRHALASFERALGLQHPYVATSHTNLGNVLVAQGKYEEAEAEHRTALATFAKVLGPEHPHVAASRNNLALVLDAQGKYEEAAVEHRRALALRERALGPEHPHVASSRSNLATVLEVLGHHEEAEAEHRAALALRERALGAEHPNVATSRNNLASVLVAQGKYAEAELEHRAALALREKVLGLQHPDVALTLNNLADALRAQGKHEAAETETRRALAIATSALAPDAVLLATIRHALAESLLRRKPEEALALAEQAWARRQRDDLPPDERAETAFVLARLIWRHPRERARARALAERALSDYRAVGAAKALEVERWLESHRPS